MSSLNLDGSQLKQLNESLVSAFTVNEFDQLLKFYANQTRPNIVIGENKKDIVFKVVEAAEMQGWTTDLIQGALLSNPKHQGLREASMHLGVGALVSSQIELQRIVRPEKGFIDVSVWSSGLTQIEGRVCRIEEGHKALGTGFLVGPELVLTNYHVLKDKIDSGADRGALCCRFDYKKADNGVEVNAGIVFPFDSDWLVDFSPYSRADTTPNSTLLAANDELDYALIRLATPASGRAVADSPAGGFTQAGARGYFTRPVPHPEVTNGTTVVIAQHPDGEPLKIAMDSSGITSVMENRYRYSTNTESGSSGSPVFNGMLELIAIHHAGDPNYDRLAHYNQGIPILKIIDAVKTNKDIDILM